MNRSDKPVLEENQVLGKRMYIFPKEYATDFDPKGIQRGAGMVLDINGETTFIPCEIPVELEYNTWSALKNIGRIGRLVGVQQVAQIVKPNE